MKDVKDYEGLYAIDENGNVWSYKSRKYLKPTLARGYLKITLYKDGKRKDFYIHRLVAEAFIPNPDNKPQVNHLDENKLNNSVSNLEWATAKENSNYGTRTERSNKKRSKPVYCMELDRVFDGINQAARELGLNNRHICDCCKGRYKTTGGYHWQYTVVED